MFNLAIDSKLRACDIVALKVEDIAPNGYLFGLRLPSRLARLLMNTYGRAGKSPGKSCSTAGEALIVG